MKIDIDVDAHPALESSSLSIIDARNYILNPEGEPAVRDALWSQVIMQTKEDTGDQWKLIAIWMIMPALRKISRITSRTRRIDPDESDAEIILTFLDALHHVDPNRTDIGSHLYWTTRRNYLKSMQRFHQESPVEDIELVAGLLKIESEPFSSPVEMSSGNDLNDHSVEPKSRSQIEGERLGSLAQRTGTPYDPPTRSNNNEASPHMGDSTRVKKRENHEK
ncbi:hypothetical protein [Murinocardiopsis flavida]|uniref:hypothetical protein n=1 Tax=Murinocardiopsis flavida TaxID=645275 RepID=UPI0011B22EFB|nr:hypothetical protein [Murinocardiopsis flavida]